MPRNGAGTYTLPQSAFVSGTTISSTAVNSDFSDIATALTQSLSADGQTPLTGSLKFASGAPGTPGISFSVDSTTGLYLPVAGKLGLAASGALGLLIDGTATGVSDNNISNANGAVLCPVGTIMDWPGTAAPTGWLLLYGQVVSQATYPGLYAVCGTTYNTGGEGTGNFRLPDCRGRIAAGVDNMGGTAANRITTGGSGISGVTLGAAGGTETHTLTTTESPTGLISLNDPGHAHTPNNGGAFIGTAPSTGGAITPGTQSGPNSQTSTNTTGITLTDHGGNGAHQNTQPTIIFYKIIFAGR